MGKISLLECTLRDGGYINDWRFGDKVIDDSISTLVDAGVDILEIGFLKNEPEDRDRTVFDSIGAADARVARHVGKTQFAVMCEVVNPLPLEMLEKHHAGGIDIIRVIVWKTKHDENGAVIDALREGFGYCKGIVDKGYKLCVQPARTDQYSDVEFRTMLDMFASLKPLAIYIVDSWGTQTIDSMMHYVDIADKVLPSDIALGYHGHNNKQQAMSIAEAFLKRKLARDIIIDASVYGIGRGAGNLNVEIFADFMNRKYHTRYNTSLMISLYEKYIKSIFEKEQWGYSIPYYLTSNYNANPDYARVMEHDLNLSYSSMEKVLAALSEDERIMCSAETVRSALKKLNA